MTRAAAHHAQTRSDAGYEAWKRGVDKADHTWDVYDTTIQETVDEYNRHLSSTPRYLPLDWKIVKAMLWVESGPHRIAWKKAPMQIGVVGDPGLSALLWGREGAELIVPPSFNLSASTAVTQPRDNIRAGIGYLLMRMAEFGFESVPERSALIYEVTVRPGDSLESIAKAQASTVEVMKRLNPGVSVLRPGQVLKCQKASVKKVITDWRTIEVSSVATRYNGGGDPLYARKLTHALTAVRK